MAGCFEYKCFLHRFPVKLFWGLFFGGGGLNFSDILAAADSWLKLLRTLHTQKKRDLGEIGAPKIKQKKGMVGGTDFWGLSATCLD